MRNCAYRELIAKTKEKPGSIEVFDRSPLQHPRLRSSGPFSRCVLVVTFRVRPGHVPRTLGAGFHLEFDADGSLVCHTRLGVDKLFVISMTASSHLT